MPAVFRPQSHLPLTPPEFIPSYAGCGGVQLNSAQYAIGMHEKPGFSKSAYGSHDAYPSFPYSGQEQYSSSVGRMFPAGPPPPSAMPSELPALIEDAPRHQVQRQEKRQEVVEARPAGGVSAHLDYEMEEMAKFVATLAQNIVQPNVALTSAFRKFVCQILSSTRLPSSTILLGLEYLSTRMKGLSNTHRSAGHVYRMLTIALLLASKFLDDNTFQNKSWAEVTGLPVAELNMLEVEWLTEIDWNLHVDPTGKKGFEIWRQIWDQWRESGATKVNNDRVLTPINTQVAHHRNSIHATFSPTQSAYPGLIGERIQLPPPQALQLTPHEASPNYWWPSPADRSPPSAPETGPATPDYTFNSNWGVPYAAPALTPTHHAMRVPSATLPPLGLYGHHHQGMWPGPACGCGLCGRGDYFMNSFGQTVVG